MKFNLSLSDRPLDAFQNNTPATSQQLKAKIREQELNRSGEHSLQVQLITFPFKLVNLGFIMEHTHVLS